MTKFLQLLFSGVALGSIYALIALGFVIIFKATEVVNFAHGSLLIVGAYFTSRFAVTRKWNFFLALLAGCAIAALVGVVAERLFVRPMQGKPVTSIAIMTIGIDILLRTETTRRLGVNILPMGDPWGARTISVGGITFAQTRLAAIIAVLLIMGAFFAWFKFSNWGIAMRAAAEDNETAALMGIRLGRVSLVAWALAGALATIGGMFLATAPSPGLDNGSAAAALRAFPAAILGGLDSTGGAIVGGLVIGVAEFMTQGYQSNIAFLGRGFHEVMAYVVMIVVLLIRPSGLFGTKEVTRV